MMATDGEGAKEKSNEGLCDESSESDGETEPAKSFHRQLSTKDNTKSSAPVKEGHLLKQTWSFQRWKRRYFKLEENKLFYAKYSTATLFDEIELTDVIVAECSIKNVNHSFQVITPFRCLVLSADSRKDMEEWVQALGAAARGDGQGGDYLQALSGRHRWYATSHARPTYCNVCREALSGVTSHGLSCEVCKRKAHKRCAVKAVDDCKWTTLASLSTDIVEDSDGNVTMPHQWVEGNLPVASRCSWCERTCGSVLRLQDWRCLWCGWTVHTACRPRLKPPCPLGQARVSVVPPTALHCIADDAWDVVRPQACSPLLVFVNSKSGDNQGVKFLRRFKQLLNPAQVFDLTATGPRPGLLLFRHFDPFRVLVCSGDGSVGWVLSEVDRLQLRRQCQVGVLPLGTGNDLARVLGWGAACDDDTLLPQLLEQYEKASTKMLDRWSIMTLERTIALPEDKGDKTTEAAQAQAATVEEALSALLQSEGNGATSVLGAAAVLCDTVRDFLAHDSVVASDTQCETLQCKLDTLLEALTREELGGGPTSKLDREAATSEKKERSKEAVLARADSFKSVLRELVEQEDETSTPEPNSKRPGSLKVPLVTCSGDTSPMFYPSPPNLSISPCPSPSHLRLGSLSPLPDFRRDSTYDYGEGLLTLPVPTEFADSRRSSAVAVDSRRSSAIQLMDSRRSSAIQVTINSRRSSALAGSLGVDNSCESRRPSVAQMILDGRRSSALPVSTEECDGCRRSSVQVTIDSRRSSALQVPFNINAESDSRRPSFQVTTESHRTSALQIPICVTADSDSRRPSFQVTTDSQSFSTLQIPSDINNEIRRPSIQVSSDSRRASTLQVSSDLYIDNENRRPSVQMACDSRRASALQIPMDGMDSRRPSGTFLDSRRPSGLRVPDFYGNESRRPSAVEIMLDSRQLTVPSESEYLESRRSSFNVSRRSSAIQGYINKIDSLPISLLPSDHLENNNKKSLDSCLLQRINNDEKECSSIMSAISNEEVSIVSEIKNSIGEDIEGPICHIDSPEMSEGPQSESIADDIGSMLYQDSYLESLDTSYADDTTLYTIDEFKKDVDRRNFSLKNQQVEDLERCGFENRAFATLLNRDGFEDAKPGEPIKYCSLAQFVEGSDIARKSFKKNRQKVLKTEANKNRQNALSDLTEDEFDPKYPSVSVVVEPPSPISSEQSRLERLGHFNVDSELDLNNEQFSEKSNFLLPYSPYPSRQGSSANLLGIETKGSPAATRRISSGSLLKASEIDALAASVKNLLETDKKEKKETTKKLPIINPLVRLPTWPNVSSGAGFIEKCLLANADALCAAVTPLMDPDETLLEGFIERCVMNNYFGIGIDAKITLDFHQKREEHPEKCRSRAKNYMWYGVLGSKQWLRRSYRNLEQRVQLECDGRRIPLPSLQGIVVLNIPSFMGGTNFWGGRKKDDIFFMPSFDDRILEVVAVFGSVQMAASRLINIQHHRIAQCQSVQINILGDEGVPIQVDGEAWIQPPGVIRIIHKNRMQMLCRNRALESSLKTWEEKQRLHSHSMSRNTDEKSSCHDSLRSEPDILLSDEEMSLLLNFIESATTLTKWVKILAISNSDLEIDLYGLAVKTDSSLEKIHPNGKMLEGESLRIELTKMIDDVRNLYEESCCILRDKGHNLRMRDDLESKLSVTLANVELELRKCILQETSQGSLAYLQPLQEDQPDKKLRKGGFSWLKLRGKSNPSGGSTKDVSTWGTQEVCTWLDTLQLSEYAESFTKNDVRGRELLTLSRRDLKDLGVTKVGHVKRILQAIKDLNQK